MNKLIKMAILSAVFLSSLISVHGFARTTFSPDRGRVLDGTSEIVPIVALEALAPRVRSRGRISTQNQPVQLKVHLLDLKKILTTAYLKRQQLPSGVRVRGLFHTATGELHVTFSRGRRGQVMIFRPFGQTVIAYYHGTFSP